MRSTPATRCMWRSRASRSPGGARLRQPQGRWNEFAKAMPGRRSRFSSDLDHDALDDSGQPRDRVLAAASRTASISVTQRRRAIGRKVGAHAISLADKLAAETLQGARSRSLRTIGDVDVDALAVGQCSHPLAGCGYEFAVPLLAWRSRHRRHRHGLRPHRAESRPRGL